jgi:hypothetical protein
VAKGRLASEAEKIIQSVEGILVSNTWRKFWALTGQLASGWFSCLYDKKKKKPVPMDSRIADQLFEVFVALVKRIEDAPTAPFQKPCESQLRLELDKYLSLRVRGYSAPEEESRDARRKDDPRFQPTHLQKKILKALEGNGLTLDNLEEKTERDRHTVVKALEELKERALVINKRGVGYYRPDAPP